MKARKAYFRSWDHQLVQEAYPFTVKPKDEMKDKWDMLVLGDAVPVRGRAAGDDLSDQDAEPLRDEGLTRLRSRWRQRRRHSEPAPSLRHAFS